MNAIEYVKANEGFVPRLYICPAGYPTIGYGTRVSSWRFRELGTVPADTGEWISETAAEFMLWEKLEEGADVAARTLADPGISTRDQWRKLTPARQAVLLDICYNMGFGVFAKFPKFTAAVKAQDWREAHDELLWSDRDCEECEGVGDFAPAYCSKESADECRTCRGTGRDHSKYWKDTARRCETNAAMMLTGRWPE